MEKVAVIIPCYNREKFILKTVNSVLKQTYSNIEIVVVDDGSTDTSRNVIEGIKNKIRILEHKGRVNKGQSAAINLGIKSTKSKYISILDSDDLFRRHKIERQVLFLENNAEFEFVYSNAYMIDERDNLLYKALPPTHNENGNPENILLECPMGCPSAYLIKRSAFCKAGYFDESLRAAQDHDMAIRLSEVSKLAYLDEILWFKREHKDSISYLHSKVRWKAGFIILKKACKRYPYSFNVKRKRLAVLHFRLGQCFLNEKKYFSSFLRFVLAGLLDPRRAIRVLIAKKMLLVKLNSM